MGAYVWERMCVDENVHVGEKDPPPMSPFGMRLNDSSYTPQYVGIILTFNTKERL